MKLWTPPRGRAVAMIAAASTVLLVGGCGGGSSSSRSTKPIAAVTPTRVPAKSTKRHHHRAPRGKPSARRRPGTHKSQRRTRGPAVSLAQSGRDAAGRLPVGKRAGVARGTAKIVFSVYGLQPQGIAVTPAGDAVRATVAPADACTLSPGAEGQIASRIKQTLPFVRSVQITVGGTGKSIPQYVAGSCHGFGLPGGAGRIVMTLRGSTLLTTKAFTVHSKRWTVEYVNGGRLLQVFALKGQVPNPGGVISVTKHGPGKHVFSGPGTYSLRIGGVGSWVVRVRDGA